MAKQTNTGGTNTNKSKNTTRNSTGNTTRNTTKNTTQNTTRQGANTASMSKNEKINANKRNIRRRKRRRDLIVFSFVVLLIAGLGTILLLTVFFNISEFKISGSLYYNNEEIINATGLEIGSNMLRMKKDSISEKLEKSLPYIGKAEIIRAFPDVLEIVITDTSAEFAIEYGAGYVLLNEDGKILQVNVDSIPENLSILKGFYTKNLVAGSNIGEYASEEVTTNDVTEVTSPVINNEFILEALNSITNALEAAEFGDITMYDLSSLSDITLVYQDRLTILLGSLTGVDNKLRLGKEAIERKNQTNPQYIGIVDLVKEREAYIRDAEHETYAPLEDETSSVQTE